MNRGRPLSHDSSLTGGERWVEIDWAAEVSDHIAVRFTRTRTSGHHKCNALPNAEIAQARNRTLMAEFSGRKSRAFFGL